MRDTNGNIKKKQTTYLSCKLKFPLTTPRLGKKIIFLKEIDLMVWTLSNQKVDSTSSKL